MWLFSEQGFLSIVAVPNQPHHLLVRARVRDDLQNFVFDCHYACGQDCIISGIIETPGGDYRWRATVLKVAVASVVFNLVDAIDYSNFKNRVHDVDSRPDRGRAYLRCWTAMADFQDERSGRLPAAAKSFGMRPLINWDGPPDDELGYGTTADPLPKKRRKNRCNSSNGKANTKRRKKS